MEFHSAVSENFKSAVKVGSSFTLSFLIDICNMLLAPLVAPIVVLSATVAPPKSTGGSTLGTHSQAPYDGAPHFVLGTELRAEKRPDLSRCVFGTGCFWGTEKGFWRLPGVFSTAVGYAQGTTDDPTYVNICQGDTNHAEVVQVLWDPNVLSFSDLLRYFWACHDPTQGNAQGEDEGTQYRSGIYYCTEEQRQLAVASRHAYQEALSASAAFDVSKEITTEIEPLRTFHFAEDYHRAFRVPHLEHALSATSMIPVPVAAVIAST